MMMNVFICRCGIDWTSERLDFHQYYKMASIEDNEELVIDQWSPFESISKSKCAIDTIKWKYMLVDSGEEKVWKF